MRYLVTGGAGFIGSHLAQALLERGETVCILDNFSTGKRENVAALRRQFDGDRLEVLEGDIRDASRVGEAVRGVEVVFHSAAFVSVPRSMDEPQECFDVNVSGTSLLFEAARAAGVRRAVIASSAAVYGESDALPLVEETPLQPKSSYAVSKRVNEMYAELFTNSFDFEVVALRYFNVYGPRQRPDAMYAAAIPIFARSLLDGKPVTIFGDGGQTRDLINIRDVVRANLIASEHPDAPGKVFNVCTGIARFDRNVIRFITQCARARIYRAACRRYLPFGRKPAKSAGRDRLQSANPARRRLEGSHRMDARHSSTPLILQLSDNEFHFPLLP